MTKLILEQSDLLTKQLILSRLDRLFGRNIFLSPEAELIFSYVLQANTAGTKSSILTVPWMLNKEGEWQLIFRGDELLWTPYSSEYDQSKQKYFSCDDNSTQLLENQQSTDVLAGFVHRQGLRTGKLALALLDRTSQTFMTPNIKELHSQTQVGIALSLKHLYSS